jgi:hypothetical protein
MPNANQNKNKTYTNKDFNKDLEELNRMMSQNTNRGHFSGGADGKRSYKLVEVDGKRVSTGRYHGDSPSTAATRVFRSLVLREDKEPGDGFTKTFTIKETTRGSGKKEYGPYVGKRSKRAKPITFKRGGETIVSKFVNEVVMKEMKGGMMDLTSKTTLKDMCDAMTKDTNTTSGMMDDMSKGMSDMMPKQDTNQSGGAGHKNKNRNKNRNKNKNKNMKGGMSCGKNN